MIDMKKIFSQKNNFLLKKINKSGIKYLKKKQCPIFKNLKSINQLRGPREIFKYFFKLFIN